MNQSETALPGKALLAGAERQITRGNYHKGSGLVWQAAMAALSAGELLWGAACHGFAAAERRPDAPHRQPRTRRELLQVIDHLHVGRQVQHYLRDGLRSTQRRLHDNPYTGRLTDDELAYEIRVGVDFVRNLLHISNRP